MNNKSISTKHEQNMLSITVHDAVARSKSSNRISEASKYAYIPMWDLLAQRFGNEVLSQIDPERFAQQRAELHERLMSEKRLYEAKHNKPHPKIKSGHSALDRYIDATRKLFELCDLSRPAIARRSRPRQFVREGLSPKTMLAVIEAAKYAGTDFELSEMFVDLLVETGVRRAEALNLRYGDLDVTMNRLSVTGKGGHVRDLPLSEDLVTRLSGRMLVATGSPPAFDAPLLMRMDGQRLTRRYLDTMWAHIRNGLPRDIDDAHKVCNHVVRYTTIWLIDRVFGESAAATFSGHKQSSVTRGYAQITWREKVFIHDTLFPESPAANDLSQLSDPHLPRSLILGRSD